MFIVIDKKLFKILNNMDENNYIDKIIPWTVLIYAPK